MTLTHQPQEIAFDDPRSTYRFDPLKKPFVVTRGAIEIFGAGSILRCLFRLQRLAATHDGIDYLQVFIDDMTGQKLWLIEDGDGGAITALLPDEY